MPSCYRKVKRRAVFVHGAGAGAWEWAIWRRVFIAHGWNTEAYDLLPAEGGVARTRLHHYVEQVERWMQRDVENRTHDPSSRTVLIGASLGGLIALLAAQRAEPAALVLVNPLPPAGITPRPTREDWPDVVPWGSARSFASTRRAMPDADDAACWIAHRRWRDESGAVLREAVRGVAVDAPSCPMLVLASECDADVSPASGRAFAEMNAAEFRLLHNMNHLTPLLGRAAHTVAQATVDWCASVAE
jgi:pimeloyl-ACP methyl ester carboxylesterase